MPVTVVRYTAKAERADENEKLIEAVMAELADTRPEGLDYQVYRLHDGVSFVHVADITTADGSNPLFASPAFQEFTSAIADRLETGPDSGIAHLVGHYS